MRLKKICRFPEYSRSAACFYPSLEIFWRERTHWSMALLGGTCLFGLYRIHLRLARAPRLVKCALGGMLITAAELAAGFTFNRKRTIWDYSRVPLNYKGQICLPFSVLWSLLCLPAGTLCDSLSLCAGTRSGSRNRVQS